MSSTLSAEKKALLAQLLSEQENENKKSPELVAAERRFKLQEIEIEKARVALEYAQVGPTGGIANSETSLNSDVLYVP